MNGSLMSDKTAFMILRSGNFLTAAGNVFTIWKRQQERGETPGITDPDMIRHFIETEKVADIILQMLGGCNNGDLVVPKMKEHNIVDLFKSQYPNSEYKIIGLRPGEKLEEQLVYDTERFVRETDDYKVYRSGA